MNNKNNPNGKKEQISPRFPINESTGRQAIFK